MMEHTVVMAAAMNKLALVLLLFLNLLDTLLTMVVLKLNVAWELNPLVKWIGFPAKVVLVSVLAFTLYKLRPGALVFLCAYYGTVVLFTVIGMLVVL